MKAAPQLPHEDARLCALNELNILDTPPDEDFDRITRLARELFNVPIALVSLVDKDRQWFKSRQGLEATETPRDVSFCGHAIQQGSIFLVEDTLNDERFHDNPLVEGEPHIRFYAGCPLQEPSGQIIGTLCVIDQNARHFNTEQCQQLRDLGTLVESELRKHHNYQKLGAIGKLQLTPWLQPLVNWISTRTGAIVISLMTAVLAAVIYTGWDLSQQAAYQSEIENRAISRLAFLRGTLETSLNSKLYMVYGLSGLAHSGYQIKSESFLAFAEELGSKTESIRSLQLARDGIVSHVWPLEENSPAIGHNLLEDPTTREMAELAIQSRRMWLVGPVRLIQGGEALIGRQPIFVQNPENPQQETFWGFATILLDLSKVLEESGLRTEDDLYRYALRGRNALGSQGEAFFGNPALFESDPLTDEISLPAGSWELGILPSQGWPEHWPSQTKYRITVIAVICLISGLVYYLLRLPSNTRRAIVKATGDLEKSEHRFRDAIESLAEGIAIYDTEDRLVIHNERYRQIYDKGSTYINIGKHFREILFSALEHGQFSNSQLDGDRESWLDSAIARHNKTESSHEQQLYDGRWIRVIERRMRDGGTVTLHMDVTERKRSEQALVSAREKAELSNDAKTRFLATVSHEVRTPLNGVLGLLRVLDDDEALTDKQKKYVQTAHQSAKQLLNILNEILDISKMEAGKLELELIPFNLKDTINGAIDLIRTQAESKSLRISATFDDEIDTLLLGDEGRIRQVLLNILSNAVKFTDEGSITVTAKSLKCDSNYVHAELLISDTGIGFESKNAETLFEPFSQLNQSSTRKASGTGLGLSICKHLVESMGGSITATSSQGHGATFSIYLELPRSSSKQSKEKIETSLPVELGWEKVRVLIAEDSATNQLVIQAMLANSGYQLDTANNGIEAVEALRNFNYDIVLMDIFMPELDGLQATQEIRKKSINREVPIIALTANAMEGDREKFISAGMDDFLAKPVDKTELLAALFRWSPQNRINENSPK